MREELKNRLVRHGVAATAQRLDIAEVVLERPQHVSADQIIQRLKNGGKLVSKATVYNTLGAFVEKGLLREVHVDPERTFYDSTTGLHHHFFNVDTGELMDIPNDRISITELPEAPMGTEMASLEVVVKVKNRPVVL